METRSLFRKLFAQGLGLLIVCISASFPALAQDNAPNAEPSASPSPANPGPQATAPANQGTGQAKPGRANPAKIKQRQLARLQKILQLTPDQQTKITPVVSSFVDQIVAVRNDSSLQPQEKQAKQKELRKQYNRQLRAFLTPQQKQALRNARGQNQGNGQNQNQNQNQNSNQEEDEKFEQGSNQPGTDI
jgi:hypothetical protein